MDDAYPGDANVLGTHSSLVGVIVLSPNLDRTKGRHITLHLTPYKQTISKWSWMLHMQIALSEKN
jgi:hypothetical protein